MKVIVAPDSYKGSLSAPLAAQAIAEGWRRVFTDSEIVMLPVADGGEGTAEALTESTRGELHSCTVSGPLGEPVWAQYAVLGDGATAVIEIAQAAGLTQVPAGRRDPKRTTTFGVGELVRVAIQRPGLKRLIFALGGSATNDGGAGLLQALGVRFFDDSGQTLDVARGGSALLALGSADFSSAERLSAMEIEIACDVDAPLCGDRGASAVFGPQKGASESDVQLLDAALQRYTVAMTAAEGRDVSATPGSGAAGGSAAGLLWLFPQARLRSGIDIVLDSNGFDDAARGADLLLTGEGRLDGQTLGGKTISGVARRFKSVSPTGFVGAFVGSLSPDLTREHLQRIGVDAVLSLPPGPVTLADAMENAADYLAAAAERAATWYRR